MFQYLVTVNRDTLFYYLHYIMRNYCTYLVRNEEGKDEGHRQSCCDCPVRTPVPLIVDCHTKMFQTHHECNDRKHCTLEQNQMRYP